MNCLRVVVWKAERARYTFTIHIYKCAFFGTRNVFLTPVMLCTYGEHKQHLRCGILVVFLFLPVSCWLTAIVNVLKISPPLWSFHMVALWCESTWRNVGFVNIEQEFLCCIKCVSVRFRRCCFFIFCCASLILSPLCLPSALAFCNCPHLRLVATSPPLRIHTAPSPPFCVTSSVTCFQISSLSLASFLAKH